jgi:dihydrofolate reductase
VHGLVNEREARVGTMLLGRGMYETLVAWETMETAGQPPEIAAFAAIWKDADKVVYSRTLTEVGSERTRIEREFDPAAVREVIADADRDLSIGGPALAAEAFRAGLVDEIDLFTFPVLVGGGKRALPDGVRLDLALTDQRHFADGVVFSSYRVKG